MPGVRASASGGSSGNSSTALTRTQWSSIFLALQPWLTFSGRPYQGLRDPDNKAFKVIGPLKHLQPDKITTQVRVMNAYSCCLILYWSGATSFKLTWATFSYSNSQYNFYFNKQNSFSSNKTYSFHLFLHLKCPKILCSSSKILHACKSPPIHQLPGRQERGQTAEEERAAF